MSQPEAPTPPPVTVETPMKPPTPVEPSSEESRPAPPPPRRPRRLGWILAVSLLSVALIAVSAYLYYALTRLQDAVDRIEEQREIIDTKETFGAAMRELVDTAREFDGAKLGDIVSDTRIESIAERGWADRWRPALVEAATKTALTETERLAAKLDAAEVERTTNASGTSMEGIIDSLGGGFVATSVGDADALCETDVLGCVMGEDPYTTHFDAADMALPYMTDELWAGIAYHEFAHVLQFTNPEETATALEAFGGDSESMADCFALTYLDGWKLDHRIWVSSYQYWDVSIGYGYTCDDAQRQVVRDWYESVGYHAREF